MFGLPWLVLVTVYFIINTAINIILMMVIESNHPVLLYLISGTDVSFIRKGSTLGEHQNQMNQRLFDVWSWAGGGKSLYWHQSRYICLRVWTHNVIRDNYPGPIPLVPLHKYLRIYSSNKWSYHKNALTVKTTLGPTVALTCVTINFATATTAF